MPRAASHRKPKRGAAAPRPADELESIPTTAAALAELEARYRPFPSIEEWRGLHVDQARWDRYAAVLATRWRNADPAAVADAQDRLVRATALDSTALDGVVAANPELTTAILSSSLASPLDVDEFGEAMRLVIECHRRAMLVARNVAEQNLPVDVNLLGLLYSILTESQATYSVSTEEGKLVQVELPRGQFKPTSNFLRLTNGKLGVFAPVGRVAVEAQRLADELASRTFAKCHPVIQAAYALYSVRTIHPFADANGRLMRTVASIYLMRAVGVPLVVFADQWPSYCQALNAPDSGDFQVLVDRVAAFGLSAMDLASNLVAPRAAEAIAGSRIDPHVTAAAMRDVRDEAARVLFDVMWVELRETLVTPPSGMRMAIVERPAPDDHREGAYRIVADPRTGRCGAQLSIRIDGKNGSAGADLELLPLASLKRDEVLPIALRETHSGELLEVALDDVYPRALEQTVTRVRMWLERLVSEAVTVMDDPAHGARAQRS